MAEGVRIAIVGATGAVGTVFLKVLEEHKNFALKDVKLLASKRSEGKRLKVRGQDVVIHDTVESVDTFKDIDIAFISVSGDISRKLAPLAVKAGALVVDDSSAFRMQPNVPLVVPEINGADVEQHEGIISIPNCTTTAMVMPLYPLHKVNPIKRIIVDSYQAVSGTGTRAVTELMDQSKAVLAGQKPVVEVYPHQIAFNVMPQVEAFRPDGYTNEERKMLEETRKIMHAPEVLVSATCVRVPVALCHSESVHVEFTHPMTPAEARDIMSKFPGVVVVDDPSKSRYPLATEAANKDEVFVGRVRQDWSNPNGLAMWIVSDNLRKGAATNALQIAEETIRRNALPSQRKAATKKR